MAAFPLPEDLTPEQEAVATEVRNARNGRLPDLFRMLLHSPNVAHGWLGLGTALRYQSSLDEGVREMLICYVSQLQNCPSEVTTHAPLARAAGIPAAALENLAAWHASTDLSFEQRAALRLAESAVAGTEPDAETLSSVGQAFSTQEILEIFALVAYYTAIAQFMNATGLSARHAG
jgi:AhpD family alkylhydroperoxidase